MKHVLIVDDEKPFLLSVRDGLAGADRGFKLHLAFDGRQAVETLRKKPIDLVVTDLKMPVMDGFQLLAYMASNFPGIPVIVMTAFGTPEIEKKLRRVDAFRYLEKPLDLDALATAVEEGLAKGTRSFIRGITLATFLQLVKLESKTCTLKIKSETGTGKLFINKGELLDAETEDLKGGAAAYRIVCWPNPEIEMEGTCSRRDKVINESIEHILLEAFRMEDERRNTEQEGKDSKEEVPAGNWSDVQALLNEPPDEIVSKNSKAGGGPPSSSAIAAIPGASSDPLREFLQESPGVREFAVFDTEGFLCCQFPSSTRLGKWHPLICLAAAARIGAEQGHELAFVEMRDGEGRRYLLATAGENQVAAELGSGVQSLEIVDRLRRFRGPD